MIDDIREIISKDFEEIYTSSLSLKLLSIYSQLFFDGKQPKYCKVSQKKYYGIICHEGIKRYKEMEKNKPTFKTKRTGIMYVGQPFCKHFNLELMSDKDATELIQKGVLKEKDFSKLPDLYKEEKKIEAEIKKEEKAKKK